MIRSAFKILNRAFFLKNDGLLKKLATGKKKGYKERRGIVYELLLAIL
jgi:hypothetical protein